MIYGCMNICGNWKQKRSPEEAADSIIAAFEAGFRRFDHADIYAGGACERAHALALERCPELTQAQVIGKAGHIFPPGDSGEPHRYDTSPAHLRASVEASLQRLGLERLDLFLIHRWDPFIDLPAVAAELQALHQRGLIAAVGVSNFTALQIQALQTVCPLPIACNQIQLNPLTLSAFEGDIAWCQAQGIEIQAWSPLAHGRLADAATSEDERCQAVCQELDSVADAQQASRSQVALAWLHSHPAGIAPIVGSTRRERLESALTAHNLPLSPLDWYRIYLAGGGQLP